MTIKFITTSCTPLKELVNHHDGMYPSVGNFVIFDNIYYEVTTINFDYDIMQVRIQCKPM